MFKLSVSLDTFSHSVLSSCQRIRRDLAVFEAEPRTIKKISQRKRKEEETFQ